MYKKLALTITILFSSLVQLFAQCAMCKTTVVNNVNHGELELAEGLNFGILYLFVTPYLAIAALGIFWYKSSKSKK